MNRYHASRRPMPEHGKVARSYESHRPELEVLEPRVLLAADFGVGDYVRAVTPTPGLNGLRVAIAAGAPTNITDPDFPGYAPIGSVGKVLQGPVAPGDGYNWWKVSWGDGLYEGWSVESAGGITRTENANGVRIMGIDVSKYQGYVNWSNVAASGHDFAFVKASGGYPEIPGQDFEDPNFDQNMVNGHAAGMLMGAYHYAYPDLNPGIAGARAEANYFVSVAGSYISQGYLRPALDVERGATTELSTWIDTWIQTVKAATGVEPLIYTYSSFATNFASWLTKYDLWVASWKHNLNSSPSLNTWNSYSFWQYGGDDAPAVIKGAVIPGISAAASNGVDVDVFNGDWATLQSEFVITGQDTISPIVERFSVTPDSVVAGNSFTISYKVSDTGGSGLKQVELWRTNDPTGTVWPADPVVIRSVSGAGNGPVSGTFSDGSGLPAATYWYGLHVVDNAVPANWNDEQNSNTGHVPGDFGPVMVTVVQSPPDLSGYDCYVPDTIAWGQAFSLQGEVYNGGAVAVTPTFRQKFYLSNDTTWDDADDVYLGYYDHTADVPAGGWGGNFNVILAMPSSAPSGYTGTGPFYIGMKTDADNNITETDETNNNPGSNGLEYDYDSFTVSATYDLHGFDCYVPDTIAWGQSFTLDIEVANDGVNTVTTDFTQGIHLSNDTVWGDADDYDLGSYLHTADVPANGYGPYLSLTRTLPSSAPSGYTGTGPFYVLMYTDLNGNVAEANETNNVPPYEGIEWDYDSFTIPDQPPTLTLTGPSSNITVTQGQTVNIAWTDSDPDDNAAIALARDPDTNSTPWSGTNNHTWLTMSLTEDPDGSGDQYAWDTTGVSPGIYSVWGMIYDGTNPEVYSRAPGLVTIQNPASEQWTGGASGQWNIPANWALGFVPGPDTVSVFDGTVTRQPVLGQNQAVKGIDIRSAGWTIDLNGYTLAVGAGGILLPGGTPPTAALDLGDGFLAVNYEAGTPIGDVAAWIGAGYNGANWAGDGITSSLLESNPTGKYGIGYVENGALPVPFDSSKPFGDYTGADLTTVLVRYTLIGDVNLDGIINDTDISLVTNHIGQTGTGWLGGDVFGYDNIVNDNDISLTTNNIGQSVGQLTGGISELSAVTASESGIGQASAASANSALVSLLLASGGIEALAAGQPAAAEAEPGPAVLREATVLAVRPLNADGLVAATDGVLRLSGGAEPEPIQLIA